MVAIEHCQNSSTVAATSAIATLHHTSTAYNQLDTIVLSPTSSATSTASTTTTSSIPPAQALQQTDEKAILPPKSPTRTNTTVQQQQQLQSKHLFSAKTKMSASPDDQRDTTQQKAADSITTTTKPAAVTQTTATKSAVSQRSVDIKLDKKTNADNVTAQQLSKKVLKLDLTGKDLQEFSLKSPKSPISARLPHQVSLTSSVDVEDRKTLREALYQGIFHRHRKTIFAMGSFLRMLRSRNSQYNTIRSSSEGEDIDEVR